MRRIDLKYKNFVCNYVKNTTIPKREMDKEHVQIIYK